MKVEDLVRLKRTVWSNGHAIPAGTVATITSVSSEHASPLNIRAEVENGNGHGKSSLELVGDDVFKVGEVEFLQRNPLNVVNLKTIERLNDDLRMQINAVLRNPSGVDFIVSSSAWLLRGEIYEFVKALDALKAKSKNAVELSAADHEEFAIKLWQRHSLPIVTVTIGRQRHMQNQTQHDSLSCSFEMDTPLDDLITSFKKLIEN